MAPLRATAADQPRRQPRVLRDVHYERFFQ
jgi:hypothetical protein